MRGYGNKGLERGIRLFGHVETVIVVGVDKGTAAVGAFFSIDKRKVTEAVGLRAVARAGKKSRIRGIGRQKRDFRLQNDTCRVFNAALQGPAVKLRAGRKNQPAGRTHGVPVQVAQFAADFYMVGG